MSGKLNEVRSKPGDRSVIGRGHIKYEDPKNRTTKTMSTGTARKPR